MKNILKLLVVFVGFNSTRIIAQTTENFEILKPASRLDTLLPEQVIYKNRSVTDIVGKPAPELTLRDRNMKPVSLSQIKTPFAMLLFWDPECGHCIVTVPRLDSLYKNYLKKMNCEILGVNLSDNNQKWNEFIDEHHLQWLNVSDFEQQGDFRNEFGITSSPVIFILDKQRNVVAKITEIEKAKAILIEISKKNNNTENTNTEKESDMAGMNKTDDENSFNIYPNPFGDEFTLFMPEINDKVTVTVYSGDGKLLFSRDYKTVNSTVLVDISEKNLPAGFYLVKAQTPNHPYSRKLVKG